MNPWINFKNLIWQSDFNGDEVGFDNVNVIGFYLDYSLNVLYGIDMETMEILMVQVMDDGVEH